MQPIKTLIYQVQQIRDLERLALERFNVTGAILMQRAGRVAFDFLQRRFPLAKTLLVFCGSGNNGGDGYVFAANAKERGLDVSILQVGSQENMTELARQAMQVCEKAKIPIETFDEKMNLHHPDVIVDAICGIGLENDLREEVVAAIKKMEKVKAPILSLDVPTGINADTGQVLGATVHATATITFIGYKMGLLTASGIAATGDLISNDLQLPVELFSYVEPVAEKIHLAAYAGFLKPRTRDWHKGLSGHVLVVGGELGYSGAARMAAEAALRVGAGLVSVATRPEHAATLNSDCPEIMSHGVSTKEELGKLIEKASVIILGPGLGQTDWSIKMAEEVFKQELALIIDADGLNLLSKTELSNENWVLTPHPGEAARLLGVTTQQVQQDRLLAIKEINKRYGGVCVLKGAGTLVFSPNSLPGLCDKGNPGMATGGMGDVLSGVIAGLMAQKIPLGEAARLGCCMHAMAGDLAAKEGERGMVAMDLMPYLRRLSNQSGE